MNRETRIQQLEQEGCTRSDAQGVVDYEEFKAIKKKAGVVMNRETKHTELPWSIEGEGQEIIGIFSIKEDHYVCKLNGLAQPFQDANANFILTACNQHYQLKQENEALRAAVEQSLRYVIRSSNPNAHKILTQALQHSKEEGR